MEIYVFVGVFLVIFVIFLLHDENYKVFIAYLLCIILTYFIVDIGNHLKKPEYDQRVEVKSSDGTPAFRYSHSRYFCPSGNSYYCVEKVSKKDPTRFDTCANCGKRFMSHNYERTAEGRKWAEESINEYMNAFIETPAY